MLKYNEQHAFNVVALHLLEQKVPSTHDGGFCAYRGQVLEGGQVAMCAAGALIKDKFYDHTFESKLVTSPEVFGAVLRSLGDSVTTYDMSTFIPLISRLQTIHDEGVMGTPDSLGLKVWDIRLRDLATELGAALPGGFEEAASAYRAFHNKPPYVPETAQKESV